jgi:hypothetical protein
LRRCFSSFLFVEGSVWPWLLGVKRLLSSSLDEVLELDDDEDDELDEEELDAEAGVGEWGRFCVVSLTGPEGWYWSVVSIWVGDCVDVSMGRRVESVALSTIGVVGYEINSAIGFSRFRGCIVAGWVGLPIFWFISAVIICSNLASVREF